MAEINQLPIQESDSSPESESRLLRFIEASKNISQFSTTLIKNSHPNSEVEFGYYAELSEALDINDFEKKIRNSYELNHVLVDWSVSCLIADEIPGSIVGVPELSVLRKKLTLLKAPSDEVIANSVGQLFAACAKRSGNSEILLRVENANDRLNYIRICEARMQTAPLEPLLKIVQYGSEGDYEMLRSSLNTQFELSLRMLPHVMRQGIFPAVSMTDEVVVESVAEKPNSSWRQ